MGSLGSGTNVSNIVYRNIYTWNSNQMYMIKSNGGDGEVSNLLFENFIGPYIQNCPRRPWMTLTGHYRTRKCLFT